MAKADGQVTKEEILTFRKFVQIPKENIDEVSKLWELAKETTDGYELYARQIYNSFKNESEILVKILDLLFEIAKSDGIIKSEELNYLEVVSKIFNLDEKTFRQLFAQHKSEGNPYDILGVQYTDNFEEIKNLNKL